MTRLLAFLSLSCACFVQAFPLDTSQASVQTFADRLEKEGFNRAESLNYLAQVDVKTTILAALDKPSTSRPWSQFAPNFINEKRIGQGVIFWKKQAPTLAKAEKRFGVPASIVIGILGAETSYGRDTGRWRALDALSTLAFYYPRRAEYFQDELLAFFLLSRDEKLDPTQPLSSYAGALGWPQFMPSNVRLLAIDFDGDGHRDLWNDGADVIGSVAHYLADKGWAEGEPIAVKASVNCDPETLDKLLADKFNLNHTVAELKALGIQPETELNDNSKALIFRLETTNGPEYWIGLQNFYVITRYNKSVNYAMVVWQLGEIIKTRMAATKKR